MKMIAIREVMSVSVSLPQKFGYSFLDKIMNHTPASIFFINGLQETDYRRQSYDAYCIPKTCYCSQLYHNIEMKINNR